MMAKNKKQMPLFHTRLKISITINSLNNILKCVICNCNVHLGKLITYIKTKSNEVRVIPNKKKP